MKNIFFMACWLCTTALCAQNVKLYDITTLQPIQGAELQIESNGGITKIFSDANGKIKIPVVYSGNETATIKHPEYFEVRVTVDYLRSTKDGLGMVQKISETETIVVSASKFEEKKDDVSQRIVTLGTKELENMNQTSMADVLQQSGQVLVQKSQLGGGSPIIRGFETNRVLIVVDGVRMNNAIYRGGHLQNVITLDNGTMDRVELVFGPGSVIYGSDALGGVMHFHTKSPIFSRDSSKIYKANAFGRYSSANSGYASHADWSIGGKRWSSFISVTYSDFGDLRQGAVRNPFYGNFGARTFYVQRFADKDSMVMNPDTNLQVQSAYQQIDFMQKVAFKPSDKWLHTINFQVSTSSDIPRYDRLTQISNGLPRFAEWYYGPQERLFASYQLANTDTNAMYDQMKLTTAFQGIEESRHDRRFNKNIRNHRVENLAIGSVNLDFSKEIKDHELRYGTELYYNDVQSTAFAENIVTNENSPLDTRYPDGGSAMYGAALYFTDTWEINPKWILNGGVRGSFVGLEARFEDTTFFQFPDNSVQQQHLALNGNVGVVYKPNASWRISAVASSGFRAPNVDDLSKVFESVPGNVILPNPDVAPEYLYNAELRIAKQFHQKVWISATAYRSWLMDALSVAPSTFRGQDSIVFEGQLSRVTTTQNVGRAYVQGLEASINGNLTDYLSINGSINLTYGRIITDSVEVPLDHIPPTFGKLGVSYKVSRLRWDLFTLFNGWKRLEDYNFNGEDNFAFATTFGMPAWYTLNTRVTYQFYKTVGLQLACENILDHNYRVFASNISAPGRNFIATVRFSF